MFDDRVQAAQDALQRWETLKQEWGNIRPLIQEADDEITADEITAVMRAEGVTEDGHGPQAEAMMNLSTRLKLARETLERLWWDKRRQESTLP